MKVDFNNVRRMAIHAYNQLVRKLNNSIQNDAYTIDLVKVSTDEIESALDNLRNALAVIGCIEDEVDGIICVLDDDLSLSVFNEKE